MGFFDMFRPKNINQGLEEYKNTAGAMLLDVRTPQEYKEGHVPGSKNIPVQNIESAASTVKEKGTPLFVYCYSGSRSGHAVNVLKHMGYTNVTNIGGIVSYSGKIAR